MTRSGEKTLITTVIFATANDTATQPGDYAPSSGTLTFNPGEATKTVTVSVNGDTLDEADERFFVNLSTAVNATIIDDRGIGTITDDDDTPQANEDGSAANPIALTEDDPNGVTTNVLSNDTGLGDTPITVQVTTPPGKGTTTVNTDKTITYKPSANANGPDTYVYTVTDSDGQTSTATVYLQITPVNDAPNIDSVTSNGSVGEGSPATITVSATDVEGDTLSYAFDCDNDSTFEVGPQATNTAQCTFNDDGTRRVNARVTDGNGGTATGFTNVTVNNVAPNAVDDTASADEAGPDVVTNVLANDTDVSGDPLTITGRTQPPSGEGSVSCSATNCTFTPDADFNGTTGFTYTINDGDGGIDTATVTVNVAATNDAPAASNDTYGVDEDHTLNIGTPGVLGNDTDVDDLLGPVTVPTAAVVNGPKHGTLTLSANGSFTYTPEVNFNGSDSFTYTANDGTLNSNLATVTIDVSAVNDAPSFKLPASPNQAVNEDAGAQTVDDLATNVSAGPADEESSQNVSFAVANDQNSLFTASGQPAISSSGRLTYTPAHDAFGMATVSVRIKDDGGTANGGSDESAVQTFTITVSSVNDLPTVTLNGPNVASEGDTATFTYTVAEPEPGAFTLKSGHPDCGTGGELAVVPVTTPLGGSFKCRFTDGPEGTTVRVQVSDSEGADSNIATQNVTVANVAPTVTLSGPSKVKKGQTKTYTFTITDPGADGLFFAASYPSCGKGAKLVGIPDIGRGSFRCKFVRTPAKPTVVLRVQDSDGSPSNVASKRVTVK